jgi:Ran GTPase-activating protein (RanGAP) involved in mRNA processing and transport
MKSERTATGITLLPSIAGEEIGAADLRAALQTADDALQTLLVKNLRIDEQGIAALATHEKAVSIKSLTLTLLRGDWDRALQRLADDTSMLTGLEELRLSGGGEAGAGFTALLSSRRLANLRSLTTCMSVAGAFGVRAAVPEAARLTSLTLTPYFGMAEFRAAGAKALAEAACLAKLRRLSIGARHSIYEEGAMAIADSHHFSELRELEIQDDLIRDQGAMAIAGSPHLRKLRALVLPANAIGEAGVETISASPNLAALETLDLSGNQIRPRGAESIAGSPTLANLQKVCLAKTGICTAGAAFLAKSAYLRKIEVLDLRGNGILEEDEIWYDQGFPIGATPAAEEAKWLRQRFGDKVLL